MHITFKYINTQSTQLSSWLKRYTHKIIFRYPHVNLPYLCPEFTGLKRQKAEQWPSSEAAV